MNKIAILLVAFLLFGHVAFAQTRRPLLSETVVAALSVELSGETAKRNLEYISRHHRIRASRGFRAAQLLERRAELGTEESANLTRFHFWYERRLVDSMERFFRVPEPLRVEAMMFLVNQERLLGEKGSLSGSGGAS